ncbi:MAG: DEAD/DEAH box helicase [Pseudomonadota bacterium]|nr:DEAD/DEAH box helicase [Pseudomonadota bacterium]
MQHRGLTLDPFQQTSIEALEAGKSVLVCAPTGTGKTIIADFVVDRALARGRDVIYTAPIKALSNQKFRDYTRLHGEEKVGLLTGDLVIRREAPCRVMTTEILRNMLLAGETLPQLDAVIIDEIHFLDDRERGTTWEELLIYLPPHVQIVGLSATLQNMQAFADWMSHVRGAEVAVVHETRRNVPLQAWICNLDDGLLHPADFDKAHQRWERQHAKEIARGAEQRGHRGDNRGHRGRTARLGPSTSHTDVFDHLREHDLLPTLYFAFSRKTVENYARGLGTRLRRSLLNTEEQARMQVELDAFAATDGGKVLDEELRGLYERGIAFHHAGTNVLLKALVEELYEKRLVKILYCTSTFALGINMPARSVVFDGLRKFDGQSLRPLRTREFMQKAGRAGRRGMDQVGHVVIRMDHEDWNEVRGQLQGYLRGEPEPVRSSFALSFNSIVNLLHTSPQERIREVVDKSFLTFSRRAEAALDMAEADRLEKELEEQGGGKKGRKNVTRLQERARSIEDRSWEEFQRKVDFLKKIGYLDKDGGFGAGAKVLLNIQIEEIFVTELVLSGMLEDLPLPLLFGLFCSVNKEFGRDVRLRPVKGADLALGREANKLRYSPIVTGAEELTGIGVTWCPDMIPFGRMWAEGRSLPELMTNLESPTDISGDLVGAFRRAKDLVGQLKAVHAGDSDRIAALAELIRSVSRDEVLVVD